MSEGQTQTYPLLDKQTPYIDDYIMRFPEPERSIVMAQYGEFMFLLARERSKLEESGHLDTPENGGTV